MSRKSSLLVVDDESSVLLTLRLILEKEGYDVITAASCSEALGLLGNGGQFDAVITDLNMERAWHTNRWTHRYCFRHCIVCWQNAATPADQYESQNESGPADRNGFGGAS